ncbi:hydrogenase nickel incorporation protein HypB [Mastigocoleus testarum]|uniref:Hydrogenase accessory protein HypB n=1 Tax=Mastigocoleus testarum BC008 TaxID=371196 RepID=A0A0V7ZEH3_9CYAN|nr:hydrogenase nickel incorporation protein HypB [Mastigocoleus testarum]KST62829.1 hydrogenase accessory protein HypB [Mastigocoleus testarum BC008]KST62881.1 hydrogenase accessory protein HypB [Mastigocoleus testarum BC008]
MCVTCGCSDNGNTKITDLHKGEVETIHSHTLSDGTVITHSHSHEYHAKPASEIHAQQHGTTISLEKNILAKNNSIAAQNRRWLNHRGILALNLMSSPGAGKTTLLTRTINDLKQHLSISVIEGDQETFNDAKKIQETGCPVIQVNTGTGCHLDATMIQKGLQKLQPPNNSLVAIENVGNLVCPALFDLGENFKVTILSVTEGEDKPIKYPHIFRSSQVMIVTKIDLIPYLQFNLESCIEYARQINPQIKIFQLSAYTGNGLESWYNWIVKNATNKRSA